MRPRVVLNILGAIITILGFTMFFPLAFSFYYGEGDSWAILSSIIITISVGASLYFAFPAKGVELTHKEGFAIVALGWATACYFGSIPYLLSGTFDRLVDAYFETTSGFTTTGATVLTNIEGVPHGILFWRSLTHWLGGMGIILLGVAILPLLGIGGMELYKAEVPGPVADKIKPRIAETAKTLWLVYVLISAAETVLLLMGGMNLFESLCHTFGTMATGGFSPKNASIGHYNSVYFDVVITLFMISAGANFSLHYRLLSGRPFSYLRDSEFRFYIGLILFCIAAVTIDVRFSVYDSLAKALRYACFQVTSIMTTTGYVTADFEKWPTMSQYILLVLMFIGGCTGSTGGAIKCMRIMLLIKCGYRELYRLVHPHAIKAVKIGKEPVPPEILNSILGFFVLYILLFATAVMIMASLKLDLITAIASVAATIGNIGPGLGGVGPTDNYAHIPILGKWVLVMCMLLGRLEIYTVIILLVPEFWKK